MVNLDPAADRFVYTPVADIRDLIQLDVSRLIYNTVHPKEVKLNGMYTYNVYIISWIIYTSGADIIELHCNVSIV